MAVRPCLRAFFEEAALPSGVFGPVLLAALRRLASKDVSESSHCCHLPRASETLRARTIGARFRYGHHRSGRGWSSGNRERGGRDLWVPRAPISDPVQGGADVETHGVLDAPPARRSGRACKGARVSRHTGSEDGTPWHPPSHPTDGGNRVSRPPPHLWGRVGEGGLRPRHGSTEVLSQSSLSPTPLPNPPPQVGRESEKTAGGTGGLSTRGPRRRSPSRSEVTLVQSNNDEHYQP